MCKLSGLTAAAKQSSGNSRKCATCPLVEKLPLRCTPEIARICNESHIEGYKKGAKFAKSINLKLKNDVIEFHNEHYGRDIVSRLSKLDEELFELHMAIVGYTIGDSGIAEVKDEMSDILSIMLHVCSIAGTDFDKLLYEALDKVKGREKNPDYKRNHPHKEYGK